VVIARRISSGTRTDEGGRFYAAGLSVSAAARKGVQISLVDNLPPCLFTYF
jgi:hypothetical protein